MPRIAVVLQGDSTDPAAWSGVPAGVSSGLAEAGCVVVPIEARFPRASTLARALRMSWADQAASRGVAAACGLSAEIALRRAGPIDGVVMIGSGYSLTARLPTVTFDDMTVAQALARADPTYESLSARAAARWRERQRRIYERCRGCCVSSTWVSSSVRDDYGIDEARIHIVGFGHNFEPRRVERDWSTPRFIFLGRDWERKRGAAVVESFAGVRRRYPEASLDLVGEHPVIAAPGVTGHGPIALGSADGRERVRSLLAAATCLVLPSWYEPFGIAYLDAAGSGIASIGTTVGGAPDAIGDGGLVVDPADRAALTAAMLELAHPATARELGERARERIGLFSWRAVAERLLRALRPPGVEVDALAPFLEPAEGPAAASR